MSSTILEDDEERPHPKATAKSSGRSRMIDTPAAKASRGRSRSKEVYIPTAEEDNG